MVLSGNFLFWTLTVHLIKPAWTSHPAQPQVVGSLEPILAVQGDDVILPCHLEPSLNVEGLTVEWMKPDLKPDPSDRLSRIEYVHLYRDRREVPDMKIRAYVRRTALFVDSLKHGNISLKIMNVTQADEGRYRCFIPKLNSRVKDSIVQLVVVPNSVKTTTQTVPRNLPTANPNTESDVKGVRVHVAAIISFVCVFLIVCGGVGGYLLKHKHVSLKASLAFGDAADKLPA